MKAAAQGMGQRAGAAAFSEPDFPTAHYRLVGEQHYSVTFDILDVGDVRESSAEEAVDADFVIELSPDKWRQMLDDICTNGRAGRDWTLNTLDMIDDEPIHKNLRQDGLAADKFHRYGPTLQRFIDNSCQLETVFSGEGVTA